MADIKLRTYQQILGILAAKLRAETDLTDLTPGSVQLTILESAAASDFSIEGRLLQLMNVRNIDKATGIDLENMATEMGVVPNRLGAEPANAVLTIREKAFTKVFSNVYAGATAPTAGDTSIKIVDGSGFDASGSIYVARGTATQEAVSYVSMSNTGSYWLVNLAQPLEKDHLVGEEVVMAKGGDRTVSAGTITNVPSAAGSSAILFKVTADYVMPDGEDTITNVAAAAVDPGSQGNVGKGKIKEFTGPPWTTAGVTNDNPTTGGRDPETDPELRQRIKDHVHALGKGTDRAITRAVIGISDDEEGKRVVSAFYRAPTSSDEIGVLFIDDGTGFAPSFSGIGEEEIVTSAVGVESFFQLQQWPLVKTQASSIGTEPFNLVGGENLYVEVDGQFEQRAIPGTDFATPGVVSAQEVAEAINKTFTSIESRAKDGRLFITAVDDNPDWIRIGTANSGTDANGILRFPTKRAYTIRLYRNDVLLEKNGTDALVQSIPNANWPVFTASESLQLTIDGIASPLVVLTDADFALYTSSSTVLGASVADWVKIINSKFIGVTAVARDDGTFIIQSNRGKSSLASIAVAAGTLQTKMFPANSSSTGKNPEFTINPLLGQIKLSNKLTAGDELKAGTQNTRGFVETIAQATFNLDLTLGRAAEIVVIADADFLAVPVVQSGSLSFTVPSSGITRITGTPGQFDNVEANDLVHLYNLPRNGIVRVKAVANDTSYLDCYDPQPGTGTATLDGITIVLRVFRTEGLPQLVFLPSGTAVSGDDIVDSINSQVLGATAEKLDSSAIRISTDKYDPSGAVSIPSTMGTAGNLGIDMDSFPSNDPHTASIESAELTGIPSGKYTISTTDQVFPYLNLHTSQSLFDAHNSNTPVLTYLGDNENFIRQPASRQSSSYLILRDELPQPPSGLGHDMRATTLSGSEFGQTDNMVFLIDNDSATKTFDIPMYVDGTIAGPSVPSVSQFDIADATSALLGSSSRWLGHAFEDYRLWLQAKGVTTSPAANSKMKIMAVPFGPIGEAIDFGFFYPSDESQPALASFSVDVNNDKLLVQCSLKSLAARSINLQPNMPVQVAVSGAGPYTYKVTFLSPVTLGTVVPGDILSLLDNQFSMANRRQMKISALSNLVDTNKSYQFLSEAVSADINGGTMITIGAAPAETVEIGDRFQLTGITKQVLDSYSQITRTVQTVGANTIVVTTGGNFNATSGTFVIGPNSYTYTTYTSATRTFAGVSPNPVGIAAPSDTLFQTKNEVVVGAGGPYTASNGVFQVNAVNFTYTSYNSATGVFTGVSPNPSGIATVGSNLFQVVSGGATGLVSSIVTPTEFILNTTYPDGSGYSFLLTHKALTASAIPSFTVAVGDKIQAGGQVMTVTGIQTTSIFDVDLPFSFTSLQPGVVSRINVTASCYTNGVSEIATTSSNQAVKIIELPVAGNDATTLMGVINNTAGVDSLISAANYTGSNGTGTVSTSTEDDLNTGDLYISLQNGESYVYTSENASPAITVKEDFALAPEIGEKVKLVPVTPRNIHDQMSRKQISGLTVAADVALVNSARSVQVSSKTPGGLGQVYAVGGKASGNSVLAVRSSPQEISATRAEIELDASAIDLLIPGHTIKMYQPGRSRKRWVNTTPGAASTINISIVSVGIGRLTLSDSLVSVLSYTHTGAVQWLVRKVGRNRIRFEVLSGTANIPLTLKASDWVLVGNGSSYAAQTPAQVFSSANQGWFQVRETDNSTYFDVDGSGVEEFITTSTKPFVFTPYHSARPGDQIVIGSDLPCSTANKGTFIITNVANTLSVDYQNPLVEVQGTVAIGSNQAADSLRVLDQGYITYRKVILTAPKPNDPTNRSVVSVSPGYDISLFNEGQGAKISLPNRLGFGSDPVPGMSGYQFWTGLKQRAQRVLDGYEPDSATFPGERAAGAPVEVREPQIQRVSLQLKIKTSKGVSLQSISDSIKSAIAGYINSLGLGQDVVMSTVISITQQIPGVDSVVLAFPTPETERVTVSSNAISRINTNDIILSSASSF